MSAFGYYEKDEIVESIKIFVGTEKEKNPDKPLSEIIRSVMEAVGYGMEGAIWEVENRSSFLDNENNMSSASS